MSDLLEDQKIHYIVKDYRRMLNMHEQLVAACKEASATIEKKDKKILSLEALLTKQVKVDYDPVFNKIRLLKDKLVSIETRAKKAQQMLDDLLEVFKPSNSEENADTSNINI